MAELEEGNALCRKEAAWVFLNMCECGRDAQATIVPGIVGNGGISAICQNLDMGSDAGTATPPSPRGLAFLKEKRNRLL